VWITVTKQDPVGSRSREKSSISMYVHLARFGDSQLTNQWLQLVKTNHDVNVRVSDRISFDGLPLECNLMAVSNKWDVLAVGSGSGESSWYDCR
jgi:hypothetical protein